MNPIIFDPKDLLIFSIILFAVGFVVGIFVVTQIIRAANSGIRRID